MTSSIEHVVVDALDTGKPYSTATIVQGLVFLSGLIPTANSGGAAQMSLREQIADVFADVDRVLEHCGSAAGSIVKTTCYLVHAEHFAEFNEVYRQRMPAPFPARTTVVTQLAAPGVLFEMDVVAVIPDRQLAGSTP